MFLTCIVFRVGKCSDVRLLTVLEIAIARTTTRVLNDAGSPLDDLILNGAGSCCNQSDNQTVEWCWKSP